MSLHDVLDTTALWTELAEAPRTSVSAPIQDWIGNRWPDGSFPVLPGPGWRGPDLPIVDDGFRAGATEWAALGVAARFAHADSRRATALELGASQAPWCLSWIRAHRKLGTSGPVRAVAFEAGEGTEATERFWASQGLDGRSQRTKDGLRVTGAGWEFEWWHRAVAHGGGVLHFPRIDIRRDNGAQAVRETADLDYRGQPQQYVAVTAVDPLDAVRSEGYVHMLHLDVQGSEEEVLRSGSFEGLQDLVGVLMLGTHSRTAEGLAFDVLARAGFRLLSEEPCAYTLASGRPQLIRDGEQLWVSPEVEAFLVERDYLKT